MKTGNFETHEVTVIYFTFGLSEKNPRFAHNITNSCIFMLESVLSIIRWGLVVKANEGFQNGAVCLFHQTLCFCGYSKEEIIPTFTPCSFADIQGTRTC